VPEDEERGQGEQLFEDLDKFFAPIQDVDWPESTDDRSAETGSRAAPRSEEAAGSEADPPLRIEDVDEDETETSSVGQDDVFASSSTDTERDEPNDDADGVSAYLLESEADEDEGVTREALSRAPGAYVDLPGPDENDDEPVVAELDEPSAATDRAPDLESVEAAADRFAASVRDEVNVGAPSGGATEEIQIAALLGDEEDEEVEPARVEASRTVRLGSEGLGGPSWQEPTALEVGADTERVSAGRDVPLAFLTGLVLTALALGAIAIGPGPFAVVASILILLAQGEFYFALQKRHYQPATALGLAAGGLMLGAAYYRGEAAMLVVLALTVVATFLWYMTVPPPHRRNVVSNIGLTLLGVAYIPLLAGYALAVLRLADGRALALSIIGLTVAYDIAAFVVGTWWGSRPLAPNISPKKSWEGAIGATFVVAAIAIGAVAPAVELLDTIPASVGLAVVVSIFAPLGDLAESLLKRDLDLKDMGGVLPGHGGVLDRIDALLFVAPAAFMYLRVLLL
jgi:phosphatidate cytidylyltransferase